MTTTGYVRQLDSVGRIVLPMELRIKLGLTNREFVEFFLQDNSIVMRKYQPSCIFCDSVDNTVVFNGRNVCKNCIAKLTKC